MYKNIQFYILGHIVVCVAMMVYTPFIKCNDYINGSLGDQLLYSIYPDQSQETCCMVVINAQSSLICSIFDHSNYAALQVYLKTEQTISRSILEVITKHIDDIVKTGFLSLENDTITSVTALKNCIELLCIGDKAGVFSNLRAIVEAISNIKNVLTEDKFSATKLSITSNNKNPHTWSEPFQCINYILKKTVVNQEYVSGPSNNDQSLSNDSSIFNWLLSHNTSVTPIQKLIMSCSNLESAYIDIPSSAIDPEMFAMPELRPVDFMDCTMEDVMMELQETTFNQFLQVCSNIESSLCITGIYNGPRSESIETVLPKIMKQPGQIDSKQLAASLQEYYSSEGLDVTCLTGDQNTNNSNIAIVVCKSNQTSPGILSSLIDIYLSKQGFYKTF